MADELVDIYDENMNPLGTAGKYEAHQNGLWHKIFFCWILRRSTDGRFKVWLQLRNKNKRYGGGLLSTPLAGNFAAGDTLKMVIEREAKNDIGVNVKASQVINWDMRKFENDNFGIKNREFCYKCYLLTDLRLQDLTLRREEFDGMLEADIRDLINLFYGKADEIEAQGLVFDEQDALQPQVCKITAGDFMDYGKSYLELFEFLLNNVNRKDKTMADELIDIYDENMNPLGTAMKSQAHHEGMWHKAFHCWIINGDQVWLQLRGKDKSLYPNLLDISAAGHIGAGEAAKTAGIREIEEELGLKIEENKLVKLFTYTLVEDTADMKVREFCPTYLIESNQPISDLKMQPEEVDGVFEAKITDLVKLFERKVDSIKVLGQSRQENGKNIEAIRTISIDSFVPHGEKYYLKVISAIERYIEGKIKSVA